MRRLMASLLCALLLTSCAARRAEAGGQRVDVYYLAADGGFHGGSAVEKRSYSLPAGANPLAEALRLAAEEPEEEGLRSAFPTGLSVRSWRLDNGEATVCLSEGYSSLRPVEQTLVRSCLVFTLCSLKEVTSVTLYEERRLLEQKLNRLIVQQESLPDGGELRELPIWLPDDTNGLLRTEMQSFEDGTAEALAAAMADMILVSGGWLLPGEGGAAARLEGSTCTLELPDSFYAAQKSAAQQRLSVYAFVNTLTELDEIRSVEFRSGGEAPVMTGIDLSGSFRREPGFGAEALERPGCFTVTVYPCTPGGALTAVRIVLEADSAYRDLLMQALDTLLHPGSRWGLQPSVPEGTDLIDCRMDGDVCVLYLSEALFSDGEEGAELAAAALAATAADTGRVRAIRIVTDRGAYHNGQEIERDWDRIVD